MLKKKYDAPISYINTMFKNLTYMNSVYLKGSIHQQIPQNN